MLDTSSLCTAHLTTKKHPLIVVLGPTCSGKTAFSIRLAQDIGRTSAEHGFYRGEIVNADSRQLYRGLDIGTAKVTEEEKQGVPHHLFDVLNPEEEVTIAWYKERATAAIEEILSRKCVPILVGGSMLYISAVIDGLEMLPPADPALRQKLEEEYDKDRGQSLYAKLLKMDPETAAAFHPNNKPYVIRAMEILEVTGDLPSVQKKSTHSPYDLLIFGMLWERDALTKRIEARTNVLLESGWVEEVQRLRVKGYDESTPAMKSHGYREMLQAIERAKAEGRSLETVKHDKFLMEAIDAKTRQYAKRQMVWWRKDPRIHWIQST